MTNVSQNDTDEHREPNRRLLIDVSKLTQDVTCEVCNETFEIVPHWHLKFVTCSLCGTIYETGIGGTLC
jgi:hypothetical protein